jgi:hypothetical protein
MSYFILPSFSKNTPNKVSDLINVSGKHTLIKTEDNDYRVAIADEPIDAKVDGKKFFCVRVDNAGSSSELMIGFTPMETFDSSEWASFGIRGFTGCGMDLNNGNLCYPGSKYHNIIDDKISEKAKEIIVILTISNNGKKKEIRFLVDGKESKLTDISKILNEDLLFPGICFADINQQVKIILIDQIRNRTPEIDELIKEYQQQECASNSFLQQHAELGRIFLQQREILFRGLMATLQK